MYPPTYHRGLDEAITKRYQCPVCLAENDVAEKYDIFSKFFFPISMAATQCPRCGEYMDRKE